MEDDVKRPFMEKINITLVEVDESPTKLKQKLANDSHRKDFPALSTGEQFWYNTGYIAGFNKAEEMARRMLDENS